VNEINSRSFAMMARLLKLSVVGVLSTAAVAQAAQAPKGANPKAAKAPEQHINVKELSTKIENVVVPLPNEVFGALDKLGSVNWHEFVRTNKGANFTERPRIALLLGTVIADGFIAVEAQDVPAVKEIGQRVQALARAIGVERSITQHAKAITEWADKKKWDSVRQELDRTQSNVQQAMNEVHDEKLSQLVSLGGWLRGTEVLTAVVNKNFTADGAELLHQPDLLVHFQTQLNGMPEYNSSIVREVQTALGQVKPMIDVGNARISADSVRKINEITTKLDVGIVTKE
jgi:Rieske Fe-S protein